MRVWSRIVPSIAAIAGSVALNAAPASAGGGTWLFEGHHRNAEAVLVSGERVRATTLLWLKGVGSRAEEGAYWAGPEDGPFYGYISPRDPKDPGFYAPPLPEDATMVGEIRFEETNDPGVLEVVLEFTVPRLEPGYYALHHCNDPCNRQIGDTWTTRITIVDDEDEALLARSIGRIERRLDRTQPGVRIRLQRLTAKVERLYDEVESLKTTVIRLEQRGKSHNEQPEPDATRQASWGVPQLATILTLLILLGAGRFEQRRRFNAQYR